MVINLTVLGASIRAACAAGPGAPPVAAAGEAMLLPAVTLTVLAVTRRRFDRTAGRRPVRCVATLAAAAGVSCAAFLLLGYLLRDHLARARDSVRWPGICRCGSWLGRRQQLPAGGPGRQRGLRVGFPAVLDRGARRAHRVLPAHPRLPRPGAAGRARAILTRGGSTLSYMSTWQGNQYWFSPDGRAAVAYRAIGAVAVTTGGPVGDPAARDAAVTGFAAYCDAGACTPCLYSVTAQARAVTERLGWKSVQVAEDTVLPLDRPPVHRQEVAGRADRPEQGGRSKGSPPEW